MAIESVFGIVFHQDKVLLIKRSDAPMWAFPGGGVERGETPEETTVRELKEETGLDVSIIRLVGTYFPKGPFVKNTNVYLCKMEGGTLIAGDEVRESRFFPPNNLPSALPPIMVDFLSDTLLNSPPMEKTITIFSTRMVLKLLRHPLIFLRFLFTRLKNN